MPTMKRLPLLALALLLATGPALAAGSAGDARPQGPPPRDGNRQPPPRHDCKIQAVRDKMVVLACENTEGLREGERVGLRTRPPKDGAPPPRPGASR